MLKFIFLKCHLHLFRRYGRNWYHSNEMAWPSLYTRVYREGVEMGVNFEFLKKLPVLPIDGVNFRSTQANVSIRHWTETWEKLDVFCFVFTLQVLHIVSLVIMYIDSPDI